MGKEMQTRLVKEAGCTGLSESTCSVTGLPAGSSDEAREREQRGGRRMVGDTRRKTGGTGLVFLSLSLSLALGLIWHVAALTDSRPGDRAGWLVLCRSSSGHGSAVSALTEIPTP